MIPNKRIYTISYLASDEKVIYTIPKQLVGNYQINTGCVIYDNEENQLTISANNRVDCIGISQKDYENISVGKDGVSVGKTKVGSNGKISTNGLEIKGSDVKVDAKSCFLEYNMMGEKLKNIQNKRDNSKLRLSLLLSKKLEIYYRNNSSEIVCVASKTSSKF